MAVNWDALVLAPLMSSDIFGEDQQPLYIPASGAAAFPIDAVFDDAFKQLLLLGPDEPAINTTDPRIGVRLAQFPAVPVPNDKVSIASAGITFVVNSVQPDGKGHLVLQLNVFSRP